MSYSDTTDSRSPSEASTVGELPIVIYTGLGRLMNCTEGSADETRERMFIFTSQGQPRARLDGDYTHTLSTQVLRVKPSPGDSQRHMLSLEPGTGRYREAILLGDTDAFVKATVILTRGHPGDQSTEAVRDTRLALIPDVNENVFPQNEPVAITGYRAEGTLYSAARLREADGTQPFELVNTTESPFDGHTLATSIWAEKIPEIEEHRVQFGLVARG